MPDVGTRKPLLSLTFEEFMAARVAELERDRNNLKRQIYRLQQSRDLWRKRALDRTRFSDRGQARAA